jgi:uncharacterized protein YciI
MRLLILIAVAFTCTLSAPMNAAADSPPGLACSQRTIVVFKNGQNPERAGSLFSAHLAFTISQLRAGTLISAGPFDGVEGGAMIFRDSDWHVVEHLLRDEPFTKGGVFAIDRHMVWNACELAK